MSRFDRNNGQGASRLSQLDPDLPTGGRSGPAIANGHLRSRARRSHARWASRAEDAPGQAFVRAVKAGAPLPPKRRNQPGTTSSGRRWRKIASCQLTATSGRVRRTPTVGRDQPEQDETGQQQFCADQDQTERQPVPQTKVMPPPKMGRFQRSGRARGVPDAGGGLRPRRRGACRRSSAVAQQFRDAG